ncbi:MAG: ATP-binding cassette domain-containing protein [Betaproteobacteria bacterium]|nr:ATP-binding cassette domain-containing protein [Betaproteobacteria bacterium]
MAETANADARTLGGAVAVTDIVHRYAGVLALNGISLDVQPGTFTAVLGPNGAGKSTLAQILCGVLRPTRGAVCVDGVPRVKRSRRAFVEDGVVLVPEGRRLFGQLSVRENLLLGAYGARCKGAEMLQRLERALELMPRAVQEGQERAAATLSGGEQQMLAVGRAIMAAPRTIVLDEPSLGLAPILVDLIYNMLGKLHQNGVTVVVIEQIAAHAMRYAKSLTVLDRGSIVYSGSATDAAAEEALKVGYLGHAT